MNDFFWTEIKLLNFKITPLLARLDIVGSRLVSHSLTYLHDIPIDIELVTFSCNPVLVKYALGQKIKNSDKHSCL